MYHTRKSDTVWQPLDLCNRKTSMYKQMQLSSTLTVNSLTNYVLTSSASAAKYWFLEGKKFWYSTIVTFNDLTLEKTKSTEDGGTTRGLCSAIELA